MGMNSSIDKARHCFILEEKIKSNKSFGDVFDIPDEYALRVKVRVHILSLLQITASKQACSTFTALQRAANYR